MTKRLSKVFLDDRPVTLRGAESAPPLSRIVEAGGKRPDFFDVRVLASPSDKEGSPVDLDAIIDRAAEPTRPIYLRTIPHEGKPIATADSGHALSRPDVRTADAVGPAPSNFDAVTPHLGASPIRGRPRHLQAVFRASSEFTPGPLPHPLARGGSMRKDEMPEVARRAARLSEAQAKAEAAADQRQEDLRNYEDALQDEVEAGQEADEDAETNS